jgi:sugar/nucleoside kinase (ribokinase family)
MIASYDLLAIGKATIDAFLIVTKTNKHFRIDKETKELCIKLGDKATVDKVIFSVGGNAANVSVGLSRMGLKTGIAAEIGSDEFTQKIISGLKKEGVSEILLKQIPGTQSPFSVIVNFKKERTIFCEDIKREHDFNFEGISAKWIYLTSMGDKWKEAYKRSLIFAKNTGAKIAFNPGTPQIDSGEESIIQILKETELLFVNKEEAGKIAKLKTDDIKKLLIHLSKHGSKTIIITDGDKGSYLYNEEIGFLEQKPKKQKVIEKTGAGDAYSSGFISAVIYGRNLKEAMQWGSINSESVITKVGAQEGLLTQSQVK